MKTDEKKIGKTWREGVYLVTAESSLEADILQSKLMGEGIPSVKNYRGASNFMEIAVGINTTQGIDIYVPEKTLEDAREIIVPVPISEEDWQEDC